MGERRESNPMVNAQLYALRQSLYAKERERIGDDAHAGEEYEAGNEVGGVRNRGMMMNGWIQ